MTSTYNTKAEVGRSRYTPGDRMPGGHGNALRLPFDADSELKKGHVCVFRMYSIGSINSAV